MTTRKTDKKSQHGLCNDVVAGEGFTYLIAMEIAILMINKCDTHKELLLVLEFINEILRGARIEAIYQPPQSETGNSVGSFFGE